MKPLLQNLLKRSSWPWLAVFCVVLVAIAGLSFSYEVYRARSAVTQYFSIWEEDIAQSLLVKKDSTLLDKILGQLRDVHSAVASVQVKNSLVGAPGAAKVEGLCAFSNTVPITLFSLPAGTVNVCYSSAELAWKSMTSPIFMLGLFLGLIFLFFGSRRELLNRLRAQELQAELSLNKEISTMSRQVAHDIRGPLTALTTLSRLSHEMTEEKKELLTLAVSRIRGIADDLLVKGRDPAGLSASSENVDLKTNEVQSMVSEISEVTGRLLKEYRFSHSKIEFAWHKHVKADKVMIALPEVKLQRILANILNNAIEASLEKDAQINVSLLDREDCWLLQIMDNGCGIPEEVLPRLMAEGMTFGKDHGHGLGLFDARKTLQSIGGDLQIRSRVAVGTQVLLIFPKAGKSVAKSS
ncbi:sensor histidine kinase [Bdellovibrio svalbardensis]|uniref:histidine kinase n=1 Tax=Bdellovibrio svalbardensis TaxID=2972972 RepID=A0ABT6DLN7_9BACT|nr:sensor histidine kinase [Bdellovibrio svalbardensis]MDG0817793.1 sensor histidine kinase [Bdellovibrio svalbardensis]